MDVGNRIRQLRKQNDMTTSELAKKCNTSQPVISKLENGYRIPDIPTLKKICEAFDMTLADFFAPEDLSKPIAEELEMLLYSARSLTPKQLKILSDFLNSITDKDNAK
ncbi:MAG TPA: helix-turn-helix transcriptional regulator [Tepidimicrobium sp.]|nr:helix-turn-helix transcriptional regulator [Tepidimicrobium sp.]